MSYCEDFHFHTLSDNCSFKLEPQIEVVQSAFNNRVITYRLYLQSHPTNVELFLEDLKQKIFHLLKINVLEHTAIKTNMKLFGMYVLQAEDHQELKSFNSCYKEIFLESDLEKTFNQFKQILINKSKEFQEKDRGWTLSKLMFLELNVNKFNPLKSLW